MKKTWALTAISTPNTTKTEISFSLLDAPRIRKVAPLPTPHFDTISRKKASKVNFNSSDVIIQHRKTPRKNNTSNEIYYFFAAPHTFFLSLSLSPHLGTLDICKTLNGRAQLEFTWKFPRKIYALLVLDEVCTFYPSLGVKIEHFQISHLPLNIQRLETEIHKKRREKT